MVVISPCMKAQGTLEPTSGHLSPLGQYTSPVAPCCLMLSREQGKQNLWEGTEGHWTKWVSSSRSWHRVQHSGTLPGGTEESGMLCGGGSILPGPCGAEGLALTGPSLWANLLCEGDRGLPLFRRAPATVECTWLMSLGEPVLPALSVARMSAVMGDWPFCAVAASGGVVREWGEMVDGGAAEKPGRAAGGIFRTSEGEGSHGWPSLPFILGTLLSQSGSGEAFLFPGRGCFPLSVQRKSSRVNSHTNIPACADYEAGNF